ncbi:hypothetical protein HNY73_000958 [Argiope bruennichi]|uniref:FHA domain-containing protein n=1 Tax=Argiope bruennichi TaxID=94029 RepID=A0A8T0G0U7_ARGBR|nr:hypothetical protein HNY73_000958 [Argiope bruennichi]
MAAVMSSFIKKAFKVSSSVNSLLFRKHLLLTNATFSMAMGVAGDLVQQHYEILTDREDSWKPVDFIGTAGLPLGVLTIIGNLLESSRFFTNMASTSKTSLKTTAYLKTIIGNSVGEIFPLTSGEITIGRNRQSAQICIRDPNVSRSHCVLKYSENGWFIKDLESVNGTFLDGKMLETQKFYPLKDGAGIYLGPPGEAPSAFIFLTKMPNEQFHEANVKSCSQKSRRRNTHTFVSNKNGNKSMKRPSDSESSNVNGGFSQRKRKAAASSSSATPTVQGRDILDEIEDVDNLSDCSISSLDSLRTRLRKMSARKKNNRNTRKRGIRNAASSSASPHLKPLSNASLASQPSTSATPVEMLESKTHKSQEPSISKEFALLNTIFNESESSTLKGRNKYEKKAQPDKENSLKTN